MEGDALEILLVARHPYGGRPPLGDWQMARALARRHRVVYVDPPLVLRPGRLHRGLRALRRPRAEPTSDGLAATYRPVVLPGANRRFTGWLSDLLVGLQLRRLSQATFSGVPVLLLFDPLRGRLRPMPRSLTVYWRKDRLADLTRSRNIQRLASRDLELLRTSDLVSCTATTLMEEAEEHGRGVVTYIPNGCDVEHFGRPRERPLGFPQGDVVLGFVGGAFWRLDKDLIASLADLRPGWTLLFVGDVEEALPERPNIVRVGYVGYEDVPGWMQHLDAGVILYDLSLPFNHGSFPIKALEYLAADVPVVSTSLPALVGLPLPIRFADDAPGIAIAVEALLSSNAPKATLSSLASGESWEDRAAQLSERIWALLPRGGGGDAGSEPLA